MSVTLEDDIYPINTDYYHTFTVTDNADDSAVTGATVTVAVKNTAGSTLASGTATDDTGGAYSLTLSAIDSLTQYEWLTIEYSVTSSGGLKWTDHVQVMANYPSGG